MVNIIHSKFKSILVELTCQIVVALLYVLFSYITNKFLISQGIVSSVWLGSGVALAALLIGGWRYLWGAFFGMLAFNVLAHNSFIGVVGVTLANVLEVSLGFWLLSKKGVVSQSVLQNYLRLILFCGGVASIVGGVIGTLTLLVLGFINSADYLKNVLTWWMGDTLGVVLLVPFALIWHEKKLTEIQGKQWLEGILLVSATFLTGQIIFLNWLSEFLSNAPKGYVMFFCVSIVAIRMGMRGATLVILITATQSMLSAYLKIGYFANEIAISELRNYWLYMLILSGVGVSLASYVDKVNLTMKQLRIEIADRIRAVSAQQETAERLYKIANQLPSVVFQFQMRADGSVFIPYANEALHDVYHVKPEAVCEDASAIFTMVHPDDLANHIEKIKTSARDLSPWSDEYRLKFADGKECWLAGNARPQREEDGSTLWHGFVIDITERKQVEQELRDSEQRLNLSQEYGGIGSWEADLINGNNIWSNSLFQLVKLPVSEKVTWNDFLAIVHPDDRQKVIDAKQMHLVHKAKYDVEYRVIIADGEIRWMRSAGRAQFSDDETPIRFIGIAQDVTERHILESELKRSNADLEQFAYAVSHDMRQPLRMVTSYLSLIETALATQLDDDTRQFLTFAVDGAKRMDSMILSLLDYSRVGKNSEALTVISTRAAIDEAISFLRPALETSGGKVEILGNWIDLVASRDELTRLFQNLIGNALKYHDENKLPHVEVSATFTENRFRVEVRDNGIGINSNQIDRLFKVFSRLQARSRFEGTGVGLALCRKIVEHHGGEIGVKSEGEGHGCVFWFELPLDN